MYASSQSNGSGQRSNRCRSRSRSKNFNGQTVRVSPRSSVSVTGGDGGEGITAGEGHSWGGNGSESSRRRMSFTPQHQKAIIEHLLITKNSTSQKNYSHVPCKFYRQGACQAGNSCPFSHSLNVLTADQTPCKYFEKGNCKFGSKCANAHILPDGTRANPPKQLLYQSGQTAERKSAMTVPAGPLSPPMSGPQTADSPILVQQHRYSEPTIVLQQQQQLLHFQQLQQLQQQRQLLGYPPPPSSSDVMSVKTTINGLGQQSFGSDVCKLPGSFLSSPFTATPGSAAANVSAGYSTSPLQEDFDAFEGEVLVPSELSELLTSKELKRRNSRPSSTSRKVSFSDNISTPSTTSTLVGSTQNESHAYIHRRTWSSPSTTTPPSTMSDLFISSGSLKSAPFNYIYQENALPPSTVKSPWNNSMPVTSGVSSAGCSNSSAIAGSNWGDYQFRNIMGDLSRLKINEEEISTGADNKATEDNNDRNGAPHLNTHADETQFLLDDLNQSIY